MMKGGGVVLEWYCMLEIYRGLGEDTVMGGYTPCGGATVVCISHLFLLTVCFYRLWLLKYGFTLERFHLTTTRFFNYFFAFLSSCFAAVPLWKISSLFYYYGRSDGDQHMVMSPFQVVSSTIEALTWCTVMLMMYIETKVYIRELRGFVRFGIFYVLVGNAVVLNITLSEKDFEIRPLTHISSIVFFFEVVFGALSLFHFPGLEPCSTHIIRQDDSISNSEQDALPQAEKICPELGANIFSRMFFGWITPLLKEGHNKHLSEKDVWRLDKWDRTETLINKFQKFWFRESEKINPCLLRALQCSLGKRFWLGGLLKVGSDISQFAAPVLLNKLLQLLQRGGSSGLGCMYSFLILFVVVAALFRKSLRLTHESHKKFSDGKLTNLMATDCNSLQMACQQLHMLWSAPFRIVIAMILLYNQLGVAFLIGSSLVFFIIPIQIFVVKKKEKFYKEGLKFTDKRIGVMNEILTAMDTIKCFNWETCFQYKVQALRGDELSWLRKAQLLSAFNGFVLQSIPVLVAVISFSMFITFDMDLTPARVFTSLSVFSVFQMALNILPTAISKMVDAFVSLKRLEGLLFVEERSLMPNPPIKNCLPAISIRNGTFSWDMKGTKPTLSNITLDVAVGSLIAVVGGTGEGKTSLLMSILGEIPKFPDTKVIVRGTVAHSPQIPWIFNSTLRDNILLGSKFDEERYWEAIEVTALQPDLDSFPGYDLVEIGERGTNLSGGQRQRISLARAVYSDSDIYIFDDPLSALDVHVAHSVFNSCIMKKLQGKTRILVTNDLSYLPRVDKIVIVSEGCIEHGSYEYLSNNGVIFKKLSKIVNETAQRTESDTSKSCTVSGNTTRSYQLKKADRIKNKECKSRLTKREDRESGTVSWNILMRYKDALGGTWVVFVIFLCYTSIEVFRVLSTIWLAMWTNEISSKDYSPTYYYIIYAVLSLVRVMLTLANSFWLIISSISAAGTLHHGMLNSIVRAPLTFFVTNPVGRIINRFSNDISEIDKNIINLLSMFMGHLWHLLSTFLVIGMLSRISLWAIFPLLIFSYSAYLFAQNTYREVKRLESVTRSPVYARLNEALNGAPTIRVYGAHEWVMGISAKSMDYNTRFSLAKFSISRWLVTRLQTFSAFIIFLLSVFAVMRSSKEANDVVFVSTVGLLLTYSLSITYPLGLIVRQAIKAEGGLNAIERVAAYVDLPSEEPMAHGKHGDLTSSGSWFLPASIKLMGVTGSPDEKLLSHGRNRWWPSSGSIRFENVVMRYRVDIPPSLCGISFGVGHAEKVGIVGRTGAGKSSVIYALFRLGEIESGRILIDGHDISGVGMVELRKVMSLVPQSPILFSGTVRSNLDPFNQMTDADIWKTLHKAHLKDANSLGLDSEVMEGGRNFSVGQRQLLSLARVLLRKSKILVLDEATASVDDVIEPLVWETIRETFKDSTILAIAHRLETIATCDRILVLNAGQVVEYDTPAALLSNKSGTFFKMVQGTGEFNSKYLHSIIFSKGSENCSKCEDGEGTSQSSCSLPQVESKPNKQLELSPTTNCGIENVENGTEKPNIPINEVFIGKYESVDYARPSGRHTNLKRLPSFWYKIFRGFPLIGSRGEGGEDDIEFQSLFQRK